MALTINVILAVLPVALIWAGYGWYTSKKQDFIWNKWLGLFGIGMLAAIVALILETTLIKNIFISPHWFETLLHAFVFVALTEELARFGMLWISYRWKKWFVVPLDFITAGLLISLGFACLENLFYAYQHSWDTMLARTFTAVPAHAAFGVIMGYYLYRYHKSTSKVFLVMAVLMPLLMHGIYDLFVIQSINETLRIGSLITLVLVIAWSMYIVVDIKKRKFLSMASSIEDEDPIHKED